MNMGLSTLDNAISTMLLWKKIQKIVDKKSVLYGVIFLWKWCLLVIFFLMMHKSKWKILCQKVIQVWNCWCSLLLQQLHQNYLNSKEVWHGVQSSSIKMLPSLWGHLCSQAWLLEHSTNTAMSSGVHKSLMHQLLAFVISQNPIRFSSNGLRSRFQDWPYFKLLAQILKQLMDHTWVAQRMIETLHFNIMLYNFKCIHVFHKIPSIANLPTYVGSFLFYKFKYN
jgi:hypothetical protein